MKQRNNYEIVTNVHCRTC